MDVLSKEKLAQIRALNDGLRTAFTGGQVLLSSTVAALPLEAKAKVLAALQGFAAFTESNDPHGEHDFGSFEVEGTVYCFKVDYYDVDMRYLSDDPSDPKVTKRVLTLMRSDEY